MSTTTSTMARGQLAPKNVVKPAECSAPKNNNTGLIAAECAPKPTENTQLSTGFINSRRAPKPATTAQPTTKEIKPTSSTGLMGSKWAPKPAQPEDQPQPQPQPEPEIPTTSERTPDEPETKPEPETTTTTDPDKKSELEVTPKPIKKSWADLYEEDVENESNITTTTSEPESDDAPATTTTSPPNDDKSTTTNGEPTKEQPKSNKPSPGMLTSRWADANYECKPAQTRAEYHTTHANDRPANKKQSTKGRRRK